MAKITIGVMGPGSKPTEQNLKDAYAVGKFCAENNITTLTGGSRAGVMHAALQGAKEAGGDTIGVLPTMDKSQASEFADHVIVTGMGSARNNINILSSDIVVACGVEAGTLSEIAMAVKAGRFVILMTDKEDAKIFLKNLAGDRIFVAEAIEQATDAISKLLKR